MLNIDENMLNIDVKYVRFRICENIDVKYVKYRCIFNG